MEEAFAQMSSPSWFKRAFVYTGSIGDFRYRYAQDGDNDALLCSVYTDKCYEVAEDRVEKSFPWNDEGVAALRQWFQGEYEKFLEQRGGEK